MPPRSGGGAEAPSAHFETLREAIGATLSVSLRLTAPLKGSLFLRRRASKPPLEGRWHAKRDGEVCRPEGGGAEAPLAHAETLREAIGAVTPLRRSAPAPLKGSLFLRRRASKPPLEGRWHAKRDGEVCRPEGGGAEAPSAHAENLREAIGAATPLRRSAPAPLKGSLCPLRRRTLKPLLEGRWHAKRDGEVCRRAAAAARKRPLHTPRLCGKPSAR